MKTKQSKSQYSKTINRKITGTKNLLKNPRFWVGIAIVIILSLCIFGPLKVFFDGDYLIEKIRYLQQYQCCAILGFVGIYAALTVIGIPGTVLTVAGGIVFGLSWGTFWSVVGATIGAIGAFWVARFLLHDLIEHKFGKHPALNKFKMAVNDRPFQFVLAVRFAPISPFNVVNFLFGLTPIHWIPYSLGTFIGIIPGTLIYTWLGVSGFEAVEGGDRLPFFIALGFLGLLSVIPLLARKKKPKSTN